jgi:protein-tyrosine phosphatase
MSELLVVCRGNICRSPAAELFLRAALGPDSPVRVASAGTHAVVGAPVDRAVAALLEARGMRPDSFRARQVDRATLRRAALVVVMSRAQRAAVVAIEPSVVRRTVLLGQAARALGAPAADVPGAGPAECLAALPAWLARSRTYVAPAPTDEIEDPAGRSHEVVERVVVQIGDAVDRLVAAFAPSAVSRHVVALRGADLG